MLPRYLHIIESKKITHGGAHFAVDTPVFPMLLITQSMGRHGLRIGMRRKIGSNNHITDESNG